MEWETVFKLLPVLVFFLLLMKKRTRTKPTGQPRAKGKDTRFERDYKPIEPS